MVPGRQGYVRVHSSTLLFKSSNRIGIQIVDAQSATFFGKRIMFLSTDHSGLNKFDGLQDENFALLIPEIKRMVKGAHSIVADRFQKEGRARLLLQLSGLC